MNPKPWLPLIASALVGSHFLAAKASQFRARIRGTLVQAGTSANVNVGTMGPSKLWSSIASRMTHIVEEYAMVSITVLFVAGMVGMLIGW